MIHWTRIAFVLILLSQWTYGEECSTQVKFNSSNLNAIMDFIESMKSSSCLSKPMDCAEVLASGCNKSGIYKVWPRSKLTRGHSIQVYCDMDTDGGGWTVIQRRGDYGRQRDYFRKLWKDYKEGFGDIGKDFWLGNDNIYSLTNQNLYTARFDLGDVEGERRYAEYDTFWIEDEEKKYTLHIRGYRGDAGDSMTGVHDKQKFTTSDQKNDNHEFENCADLDKGGWWYNYCLEANLNGIYFKGKFESRNHDGVLWQTWKGWRESLEFVEIKIRPKNFIPPKVLRCNQNLNSRPINVSNLI